MTPHWNLLYWLYTLQSLLVLAPVVVAANCFQSLHAEAAIKKS